MIFKKYSEIENSCREKTLNYIIQSGFGNMDWVVTEKVHGSNFSFHYDGTEFKVAKRTEFLTDSDNFYNSFKVVEKYRNNVINLFESLSGAKSISVYGEIYGGTYPHPDIPKSDNASKVQKGIYYNPDNDFYAFDIRLDEENYVPYNQAEVMFKAFGFFYAKPLLIARLDECLKYPNCFQTEIPKWLNLPPIDNNNCEGVVIKPIIPQFFNTGERVILKNKNEKWSEKSHEPKVKQEINLPEDIKVLFNHALEFLTENRIKNVVSKIGTITEKDFGMLLGKTMEDIFVDFKKEYPDYENIEKENQKIFNKLLNKEVANFIRERFINIIDGNL